MSHCGECLLAKLVVGTEIVQLACVNDYPCVKNYPPLYYPGYVHGFVNPRGKYLALIGANHHYIDSINWAFVTAPFRTMPPVGKRLYCWILLIGC